MNRWLTQKSVVNTLAGLSGITLVSMTGCAGVYPAPTQQVTDVESASRSANELGAQHHPQAQLYLKLADEQLGAAKAAAANEDNANAARLLTRAKVDAELAIALTRGGSAAVEANKAVDAAKVARSNNIPTGATP
jgi:Domain of unknown function (DUF4398)